MNDILPADELSVEQFECKLRNLKKFFNRSTFTAAVKISDRIDRTKFIRKFDTGFYSVAVVDEDENFIGTVTTDMFRADGEFKFRNDLFLQDTPNEEALIRTLSEKFLREHIRELPILNGGKVTAFARIVKTPMPNFNEKIFPPIYWDLISDEVALKFFEGKRRLLLSSEYCALDGFRQRFNHLFDVRVFDDSQLEKYLSGAFDALIFVADIWSERTFKIKASSLFNALFAAELSAHLHINGVRYFRLLPPDIPENERRNRVKYCARAEHSPLTFGGANEDYLVHADKHRDSWNSTNGFRRTVGIEKTLLKDARRIYFFGACSAVGLFVDDAHTIESLLQQKISGLNVKVINCANNGGFDGAHINELYRIADTHFRNGDIVIHMPEFVPYAGFSDNFIDTHSIADVFNEPENKSVKPFRDLKNPNHFNAEGNELLADFLRKKLQSALNETLEQKNCAVPTFFSAKSFVRRNAVKNADLQHFLDTLQSHKVNVASTGAIVMNCNPFTLGHLYLIEQALAQSDFLYVFVVEEDSSMFGFRDRFELVELNCADFDRIKILPSGRFMISLLTFAEYFKKDCLQEKSTAVPALDVQIFGRYIAPVLGIKKRFAGSEPSDAVTAQYNNTMRNMLPDFGIEFVEIPRLTVDNEVISASKVRALLTAGELDSCKKFLTAPTFDFLSHLHFNHG